MSHWSLVYLDYVPEEEGHREALCAVGNGYFVTRGAAAEAEADGVHYPGTYVAGLYDRLQSEVSGRTVENEDLVNVPNWLPLTFRVDGGPWFHIDEVAVLDYRLELDMRRGVYHRRVRCEDSEGRITQVNERRFVAMAHRHVAALELTVCPLNWSGRLTVRSSVDGTVVNDGVARYRDLEKRHLRTLATTAPSEDTILLEVETLQSKIRIAQAARTRIRPEGGSGDVPFDFVRETATADSRPSQDLTVDAAEGEPVVVEKVVSLFTSRDSAITDPGVEATKRVERCGTFEELLAAHVLAWDHLWKRFAIELGEGEGTRAALCLHIFHLLQTVSPNSLDVDAGIPARGWHGEAYRGHVFWDELFIFPFLNSRLPEITKSLLQYRFRRLPEAVWAACEAGYRGAMFPWQSASNGREETQTLHLNPKSGRWLADASHLQRHINLAVAYNVWQYWQATGDRNFLGSMGAELYLGICRFWASMTELDKVRGRYVIKGVMGPDEYHESYPGAETPGLDNNAYTNAMTAWVLAHGIEILDHVPGHRREELVEKLDIRREELEEWEEMSSRMFIPFHDGGIISQFEGYEDLAEFDWVSYTERYGDISRLDRILEAEGDSPNNYRVSKQADVLMLFYLFSPDAIEELWNRLGYEYDSGLIPRNVEYYGARTCHGSTLSSVVHSWIFARMDRRKSWEFFKRAVASDIKDVQGGTTREGIHLGAMAGTVDLVQRGYMGMEMRHDKLIFDPALPDELRSIGFHMQYRGQCMDVSVEDSVLGISLRPGEESPIDVVVRVGTEDRAFVLKPGETQEVRL